MEFYNESDFSCICVCLYLYFYCDADTFQLQAPNKDALLPQCMKGLSGASECSIYTHAASRALCAGSSVYVYCTQHRQNFKCSTATRKNEEKKFIATATPCVINATYICWHTQPKIISTKYSIKIQNLLYMYTRFAYFHSFLAILINTLNRFMLRSVRIFIRRTKPCGENMPGVGLAVLIIERPW